jgi:hypothetical protein
MAQSPLLGGDRAPQRHSGASTDVLGPSDTSDTGSDLTGAVGAVDTDAIGLDGGTNDDVSRAAGAGADVGDANLDSDSDSGGSGERAEAGRDTLRRDAPDIGPDQVIGIGSDDNGLPDEPDQFAADNDVNAMGADDDSADLRDTDEIDSDLDDGLTARPPQGRPLPREQRNTDRPIAAGARRDANEAATSGGKNAQRPASGAARDRREAARTGGGDPVSDRDKSIDA